MTTEVGGKLGPIDISFQKKQLRKTLPPEFCKYLDDLKNWFCYMENFRHALAHRIPLYVPPYTVVSSNTDKYNDLERRKTAAIQQRDFNEYERLDAEQTRLGKFTPAMTHSQSEGSDFVYFHPQVLADWNTVAEIANKFLAQLTSLPTSHV